MARGFESKAVESQQADATNRTAPREKISPAEAARRAQLATLMLARTRAEADLGAAKADAHRAMLERAIADLDRQIDALTR